MKGFLKMLRRPVLRREALKPAITVSTRHNKTLKQINIQSRNSYLIDAYMQTHKDC